MKFQREGLTEFKAPWKIHTTKLLALARTYGFWNYSSKENREDMLRYIEALFYLI